MTWWWIKKIEASWETAEVLGNTQRLFISKDIWGCVNGKRVREYFLREIGCWKIWIFADTCTYCVQENMTYLRPWSAKHITALARPSFRISGEPPRSVLLRQSCRVGSFLWKPGVSPSWERPWRQPSISPSIWWGNLRSCNFQCGEGELDSSGCSGWKPAICFQVSTGGLWHSLLLWFFASFSVSWLRNSWWLTESSWLSFLPSIHGQPFISPLSL